MRDKITLERLSISGPACKELRSHHSILIISKKAEQIEKSTFLRFIIEARSQSKLLPPKLETHQVDAENHSLPEQKPQAETSVGARAKGGKPDL